MVHTQADLTSWARKIVRASLHLFVPILIILLCPGISWAGSPVYGAKSAAMGTAFGSIADDPSTMSSNVAGLTGQRGTNLYVGGTAVNLSTKFRSPSGQTEETASQFFFPPHLYISSDFGLERVTFGLGFFSPFGIGGRKWSEEGLTRYVTTENTVSTLALNPSFAWKILPSLSFGFGVSCVQSVSEAEKMLNQSTMGAGDAYYQSPIPEHTFSPSSPDSHQHDFSVGLGWDRGRWTIDGFYVVALYEKKSVRNDILSGTYENLTHAFGLSAGYRF